MVFARSAPPSIHIVFKFVTPSREFCCDAALLFRMRLNHCGFELSIRTYASTVAIA
jgi:hypothetical protein